MKKLSVKELIEELKKYPKDAFVVIGKHTSNKDMTMIDGARLRKNAVVELILGNEGYW